MNSLIPVAGCGAAGLLEARANASPDRLFLTFVPFEGDERRWSYGSFAAEVARVAGGLVERGVNRGDRVLVFAENCPEVLLAYFASSWIGATCVLVNAALTGAELARLVSRTNPVGVVTQPGLLATAERAVTSQWIAIASSSSEGPTAAPYGSGDAFDSLLASPITRAPIGARETANVLFTSGTTAEPKGVVWTHANVLWGARLGAMQEGLRDDDIHFVFLPLFHVVALTWSVLPTIYAGGSIVLHPRFSARRFWDAALKHRCTWASMVPPCTAVLARHPVPDVHQFRMWGHAFASADYEQRFHIPRLLGWWGMTEIVTQGIIGDPVLAQRPGSIGRPSPAYGVEVVGDDGRAAVAGEAGELRIRGVRGVSLFAEYLDDAEATRDAFDEQGRFQTGDRVKVVDDGVIQFIDRIKDVIRVGGEGVAAPEIERLIGALPGVREAAVVGRRDDVLGEVPVAFVIPDGQHGTADLLVERVLEACRNELASFKIPRAVVLVDELPRAGIGKVSKAALRKRVADGPQGASAA